MEKNTGGESEKEICCNCLEETTEEPIKKWVYETPWDKEETLKTFCSEECEDDYLYGGDFSYQFCNWCNREICFQHPRNGWHVQFREWIESNEFICLSCYQTEILENGLPREYFEKGNLSGIFFSYGNIEAKERGFEEVPGFSNYHVRSKEDANKICKKALSLIDVDAEVIVAYESMAIGGLEGYITLMSREKGSLKKE